MNTLILISVSKPLIQIDLHFLMVTLKFTAQIFEALCTALKTRDHCCHIIINCLDGLVMLKALSLKVNYKCTTLKSSEIGPTVIQCSLTLQLFLN